MTAQSPRRPSIASIVLCVLCVLCVLLALCCAGVSIAGVLYYRTSGS